MLASLFQKNTGALASDGPNLDMPPTSMTKWIRALLIVFLFSFVLDYKNTTLKFDAEQTGGSVFQYLYLLIAVASSGLMIMLGWRHLLVRPGVYITMLWWGYLVFMFGTALYHGNDLSRIVRLMVSPVLIGLGITSAHIAACSGIRPVELVKWFLVAGVINVIWKFGYGFLGAGMTAETVRMEILSPAMRFLFAWIGCALLLRRKFSFWILVVLFFPMITTVVSITRSIAFPITAAALGAGFCLILGMMWRIYGFDHPLRKAVPIIACAAAGMFAIILVALTQPVIIERWSERLFSNTGVDASTTEDLSAIMRKAEAEAMVEILSEEPTNFIWGMGPGASYFWHEDYFPELFQVYKEDRHQFGEEIYTAGHSTWTYTLFSSGVIGIFVVIGTFFATMYLSLASAKRCANATLGRWAPDVHLMFLPFIVMLCVLSESITRNPFDERFTGILFGLMVGMPQFFFNRAYYIKYREDVAAATPQVIIDESQFDTWDEPVPHSI